MFTLTTSIQCFTVVLFSATGPENISKKWIGKKEIKLTSLKDNVISFAGNIMKFSKVSEFEKIIEYRSTYKNKLYFCFLEMNNCNLKFTIFTFKIT